MHEIEFQQCTLHNHNEQFYQVGLLDRASSHWAMGLALESSKHLVSSDFVVLCKCSLKINTYFTLTCRGLGLVGLALYLGALTKCCPSVLDTVGWVI